MNTKDIISITILAVIIYIAAAIINVFMGVFEALPSPLGEIALAFVFAAIVFYAIRFVKQHKEDAIAI